MDWCNVLGFGKSFSPSKQKYITRLRYAGMSLSFFSINKDGDSSTYPGLDLGQGWGKII